MKNRILAIIMAIALVVSAASFTTAALLGAKAAVGEMEVDTDDYPLYVRDTPDGITDAACIYAALTKYGSITDDNTDTYDLFALELLDSDETTVKLKNAMAAYGLNPDENRCFGMLATLYKYDEDSGDEFVSKESQINLLTPLSDNMYQYDEEEGVDFVDDSRLMIVSLTSTGTLKDITSACTLVYADDILSAKMTITSGSVYGFILKGVAPESDEETLDPWEIEDPEEPEKDPEEDNGDTEVTSTPTPTPAPTTAPADGSNANTATPTPTQAAKATPTPAPTSSGSNANSNSSGKLDNSPKTGDEHSSLMCIGGAGLAVAVLAFVIRRYKRL